MIASCLLLALALPRQRTPQNDQVVPAIQDAGDDWILTFAGSGDTPDGGMSLAQFVRVCEQVTGVAFSYTTETSTLLDSEKVRLLGSKRVPKDQFYSFFQIMMIINDFVCSEVGPEPLSVVVIESLRTQARNTVRGDAVLVDPDELDKYANQPATLITTVINLPNTDVRQLSNSMRTMITDANTQQMLPAGNTNAMVLTGFGSQIAALARMLRIVDEASRIDAVVPEFEVIPIEYSSAEEIATTIEELLDASQRARQGRAQQQAQVQGATGVLAAADQQAKIMTDPRTNSLLVMAMPEDMPNIKELVARLDVDIVERERTYHIYNLENVNAGDLAETLNDFLQDASRLDATAGGPGGGAQGQARQTGGGSSRNKEFVVVADEETNSLLIAANRSRYEELLSLVQRLDRRQDQVLIETALIELSGDNLLDIGVELGLADIDSSGDGSVGVTSFGLSTIDFTDPSNPQRIPSSSFTGLAAGIISGDNFNIPMLVAALEQRRNTNVLSIPSVLVNNNGSATVVTKDEQPTTQTTLGTTSNLTQTDFAGYEEAGITMTISPSISASRHLRLNLFLEISNFEGAVQGAVPPPRTTRTIQTSVNVPDGDTMVIGGIVLDNASSNRRQVPLLGDIPILGYLFRRTSNTQERTILYFFVTPHILEDEQFADLAEISYRKKLEAADTIGADRVRLIDPDFGQTDGPIDLSGFDVPLYSSPERGEVRQSEVGIDPVEMNEMLDEGRSESEPPEDRP